MIRILVVDDHPIVRAGLVGLLDTEPDFEVVGEADSGEIALELLAGLGGSAAGAAVDVVLMDLRMPGMGGVEATRRIVRLDEGAEPSSGLGPSPSVLVFTTYEGDDQILAAIEAGASGYLVKAAPAEELAAGIRAVAAGQTVLAPGLAAQLARAVGSRGAAGNASGENRPRGAGLTPREAEILALVADGLSNPQIAARLYIGESTVKTHLLHAFEKLGVSDRTRAVVLAKELGLL